MHKHIGMHKRNAYMDTSCTCMQVHAHTHVDILIVFQTTTTDWSQLLWQLPGLE